MKKLKKLKEEFKGESLPGKTRILFFGTVTFVIVGLIAWLAIYLLFVLGMNIAERHLVRNVQPLSNEYSLKNYKNGDCRIIRREDNKMLGERFRNMEYEKTIRDSVVFLYKKNGEMRTFSLKTGLFSEDSYDYIDLPDPAHHYCACSQKGLLGFIDCHTGKLVIPLKFYEENHFFLSERRRYGRFYPIGIHSEPLPLIADDKYEECCAIIDECRQEREYDPEYERGDDDDNDDEEGIIRFKGDYCIVPTTVATSGVIDTHGNLLLDGYDWIEYNEGCKLFKTVRNRKYSIFAADGMRKLLSDEKKLYVLPIGVLLPEQEVLVNHACTDTLTNLIIDWATDGCEDLSEYGDGDYRRVYLPCDLLENMRMYYPTDNRYKIICSKSKHGQKGVKRSANGEMVVKPMWEEIKIYRNAANQYLFFCTMDGYGFLVDEEGQFLKRI
jgi:hypothetical protein